MIRKGVIFDLDGTLWEVTNTTYESVNEIVKRHNLKEVSLETIHSVFGLNREEVARLYFPYLELEEALKLVDEASTLNAENLRRYGGNVYPNVEEVLKRLKENYELFIVSNAGQIEYIDAFLDSSELRKYFVDYIAASQLNISKADAILKVIKEYNLDKYVYVGDTIKDLEATRDANVPFIQAKYGFGSDLHTQHYINQINELPKVVNEILT